MHVRFKMHLMLRHFIHSHALHCAHRTHIHIHTNFIRRRWHLNIDSAATLSIFRCVSYRLFCPGIRISNLNRRLEFLVWENTHSKLWPKKLKIKLNEKQQRNATRLLYAICVQRLLSHLFAFSSARKRLNILNEKCPESIFRSSNARGPLSFIYF